ncbi:MAG: type III-B CRISPR module-associated protein Cmr5 [Mariniphaga sp.]
MKTINRYLQKADAAIISTEIAKNTVTHVEVPPLAPIYKVQSSYKGAISSFGASLIMSGLIPTIQFYMSDSNNRDSDHGKIISAIAKIIYESPNDNADFLKNEVLSLANNRVEQNKLRNKIADAAIALKIMLRTYEFQKKEDEA